jgi:hypothetical protein
VRAAAFLLVLLVALPFVGLACLWAFMLGGARGQWLFAGALAALAFLVSMVAWNRRASKSKAWSGTWVTPRR